MNDMEDFSKAKNIRLLKNRTPASFMDIFGDLTDNLFTGDLDLNGLNLTSLEGCPKKVINGHIFVSNNPKLKNLDHFPEFISVGKFIMIDYNLIESSTTLNKSIYMSCLNFFFKLSNFDNNNVHSDFIAAKTILNLGELIKDNYLTRGKIKFLSQNLNVSNIDVTALNHAYNLFEKVGFSTQKFENLIKLLSKDSI